MLLDLNASDCQMRRVYELEKDLAKESEHVKLAQALTLNPDKPLLGLKGTHGLFGSTEWWSNIRAAFETKRGLAGWWNRLTKGQMKVLVRTGIIERTYFAGQDARWGDQVNSFVLKLDDGTLVNEGIYANQKNDKKLFVTGARVVIAYVYDELKAQPSRDGSTNYAEVVLEMAVSTKPVSK